MPGQNRSVLLNGRTWITALLTALLCGGSLGAGGAGAQESGVPQVYGPPDERGPAATYYYVESELDELVAPIALYPDDLLAIVLPAAAYPLQIVEAARLLEQSGREGRRLEPDPDWDDAVVALLNYPDALRLLNDDLDWTWRLGDAVINQQADVLAAVDRFRERAYAAGNLRTDDRQIVRKTDDVIEVVPADPEVIYVPYYEPEQVIVYQPVPVYYYYPRPCPVYYYPYPADYHFVSGFFWGVTTVFSLVWDTRHHHHVHVHHYWHHGHPYHGHHYHDRWYRERDRHEWNRHDHEYADRDGDRHGRGHRDRDDDDHKRYADRDSGDAKKGKARELDGERWQPDRRRVARPVAPNRAGAVAVAKKTKAGSTPAKAATTPVSASGGRGARGNDNPALTAANLRERATATANPTAKTDTDRVGGARVAREDGNLTERAREAAAAGSPRVAKAQPRPQDVEPKRNVGRDGRTTSVGTLGKSPDGAVAATRPAKGADEQRPAPRSRELDGNRARTEVDASRYMNGFASTPGRASASSNRNPSQRVYSTDDRTLSATRETPARVYTSSPSKPAPAARTSPPKPNEVKRSDDGRVATPRTPPRSTAMSMPSREQAAARSASREASTPTRVISQPSSRTQIATPSSRAQPAPSRSSEARPSPSRSSYVRSSPSRSSQAKPAPSRSSDAKSSSSRSSSSKSSTSKSSSRSSDSKSSGESRSSSSRKGVDRR